VNAMNTILQTFAALPGSLQSAISYADALSAAIRRHGNFVIDGFVFKRREDISIPTDYVSTGRHTMIYELPCGKQYRIIVEPVQETHGSKSRAS